MNSCNDEADAIEAWNTRTPDPESAAEIERLRRDSEFWKSERDRIKAFLSDGGFETIESEQAWKDRALTAESLLAAAWENAAKIVENFPTDVSFFRERPGSPPALVGRPSTLKDIAAALRAAGKERE